MLTSTHFSFKSFSILVKIKLKVVLVRHYIKKRLKFDLLEIKGMHDNDDRLRYKLMLSLARKTFERRLLERVKRHAGDYHHLDAATEKSSSIRCSEKARLKKRFYEFAGNMCPYDIFNL